MIFDTTPAPTVRLSASLQSNSPKFAKNCPLGHFSYAFCHHGYSVKMVIRILLFNKNKKDAEAPF